MLLILKLRSLFVLSVMENYFPSSGSMYTLLLQIPHIYLFCSESRVAGNTILFHRDVLWAGQI